MLLQKTATMKSCIGIYVAVATISILEASASTYGSFGSSHSNFGQQPQWPAVQPTTQRRPGLFQLPAQSWASTNYQQPAYHSNSYSSSGSASSAYQNTPSPYNTQPVLTNTLPLSSGGSLNGAYNGQTSYLSSKYPLAFQKQGYAINQQRIASASNAGATSSAATGFPVLDGISNSHNSYLPYKDPLRYGSQGPALFKQGSASSATATSSAVVDSSIQDRLNAGQNMYFNNPLRYGNYGVGLPQQGTNAVSDAQVSSSVAATSDSYLVQPSSQPGGILNSDKSSRVKFLSVPLPSQRTQTLHLPINIKDSNLKVIHRNSGDTNAHGGISSDALEHLSKINSEFKQIESNPQSFTETDYFSQESGSQSEAQATSNSGFGNLGTGNNPLYGKRGISTQQRTTAISDAQAASSVAAISDLYPAQPPSSQSYGTLNSDELSKIKSSLPLSLQSLGLPINIKDAHLRVIHRNPIPTDGSKTQGGISSDALGYLSKISSEFGQIESNPESFSETDYPSQPITQQSTSQSKTKATSNSATPGATAGSSNQDATYSYPQRYGPSYTQQGNASPSDSQATSSAATGFSNKDATYRYPQSYSPAYTKQGIASASDAQATSSATAGSSNQDVTYSYPQGYGPSYTQQGVASPGDSQAIPSAAAGSSNQDRIYNYPQGYSPDSTPQAIAGASDAQATASAAAGSSNQDGTYNYPQGYGSGFTQQGIAGASDAQATSSAAAGSSNQDGTYNYPQGYGSGSTQQGIAGASDAQATSSATAGSSNQDGTYNYPQRYSPGSTPQAIAGASDAQATASAAAGSSNQDATYRYRQGYSPGHTQQGIASASDAQATSSATAGSSNQDATYSYPQGYGPSYTQLGIASQSDSQAASSAAAGSSNQDGTYGYPQGYGSGSTQQGIAGASDAQATSSAAAGSSNQDGTYRYPQGYGPSYTQQGADSPSNSQAPLSPTAGSLNQDGKYTYPQGYGPSYTQQGVAGPSDSQATSSAAAGSLNQDMYPQGSDPGYTQQVGASDAQATSSAAAGSSNQDGKYTYPQKYGPSYTQQGVAGPSDSQATSSAEAGSTNQDATDAQATSSAVGGSYIQDATYRYPQGNGSSYTQQGTVGASDAQATSSAASGSSDQDEIYSYPHGSSNQDATYRYPLGYGPDYTQQDTVGASFAQATSSAASGSSDQDETYSYPHGYVPGYTQQEGSVVSDAQATSSATAGSSNQDGIYRYPQGNGPNKHKKYYGGQKGSITKTSGTSESSVSQSKASTTTSGNQGVVSNDGKPNTINRQNSDELDLDNSLEIPINNSNLRDTPDVITERSRYTSVQDNAKNKYRDEDEDLNSDEPDLVKNWPDYDDQVPNSTEKETDYASNWPNIGVNSNSRKRNYNKKNGWLDNENNVPNRKDSYHTTKNLQTYENSGKYPNKDDFYSGAGNNLYAYTTLAPTNTQSTRYYQPHLSNQHHKVPNRNSKKPYLGNYPDYSQTTAASSFTSSQDYEQGSTPLYEPSEDGWGALTTNSPFSNDDGIDRNVYSNGFIQPTLNPLDFSIPNEEASDPLYYLPNFRQKSVDHRNKYKPKPSDSLIYPYYYGGEADATSLVKSQNTPIRHLPSKYPANIESATYYPEDIQSSTVSTQGYPTTEYLFENVPTNDYSSKGSTELYPSNSGSPNYRRPTNKYQFNKRIPNTTPNFPKQDKQYDSEAGSSVTNSLPSLSSQKTTDVEDSNATESPSQVPAGSNTKKKGVSASSFFKTLLSEVRKQKSSSKTRRTKCGKCDDDDVPSDLGESEHRTSSEELEELIEQTNGSGSKPAVSNISKLLRKLFG